MIDDEPMIRTMLCGAWPDDNVEDFELPRLALERANLVRFDVIFCDLMMPDMSGIEVHRELVRNARLGVSGFVLMTGAALEEPSRSELVALGIRILRKPFRLDELFKMFAESAVAASV